MKILLIPESNSLSHIAKCLAVRESLLGRGHEAILAVNGPNASFLEQNGVPYEVISDIQEADGAGLPTVEWFRRTDAIMKTIRDEVDLFERCSPDRVLGVFRFTARASAKLAGIPYDSLICGCMLPESNDVLGFVNGEEGSVFQKAILDGFYRYGAAKLNVALKSFGLDRINDMRFMLHGEHTFLWDFPEFFRLPDDADVTYVGPVSWDGWPCDDVDTGLFEEISQPVAIVSFGTCMKDTAITERITGLLNKMGYFVVLAAGGQKEVVDAIPSTPSVMVCKFAPLEKLLPQSSLLVTHGGQLTIFEALRHQVPMAVIPFQPEQAHNGVCLERIGCGVRLAPSAPFQGNSRVYTDRFKEMTDKEIMTKITALTEKKETASKLAVLKSVIDTYKGAEAIVDVMEIH
jgi:UDP:flavonoid glycosyltransferase YjiC (YdhE family)